MRNKCTNAGVRPPLMSAINETWRNYCARSLHRNRGFCAYLILETFKCFSKSRWIHAFAIEKKMQCNVKTCRHGCVLEADRWNAMKPHTFATVHSSALCTPVFQDPRILKHYYKQYLGGGTEVGTKSVALKHYSHKCLRVYRNSRSAPHIANNDVFQGAPHFACLRPTLTETGIWLQVVHGSFYWSEQ